MPEVESGDVRISYDAVGEGRPLVLLHGWCCDRSWWTEPGYVDELRTDHRLVNVDIRGSGASDKPHEAVAYTAGCPHPRRLRGRRRRRSGSVRYLGAVLRRTDRVDGCAAAPERVPAIVTSGFWDPRPLPEEPAEIDGWDEALRQGGTSALVDRFKVDMGEAFDREFPSWAQAVVIRADPEALLASRRVRGTWNGIPDEDLTSFPVPALLIAGELEDEDDHAAKVAAMIPNGQTLRLPGLGHGGACAASALTVPTARAFLDRWFA